MWRAKGGEDEGKCRALAVFLSRTGLSGAGGGLGAKIFALVAVGFVGVGIVGCRSGILDQHVLHTRIS